MAYSPTVWDYLTAVNPTNLNKIEQGILNASQNSVSVNNGILEFLNAGAKLTRNVADANTAFAVDKVLGTGNIFEARFGGVSKFSVTIDGMALADSGFSTSYGLSNSLDWNNAYVNVASTGTVISRNIADANPALIVKQAHASSTGDIARFTNSSDVVIVGIALAGLTSIHTMSLLANGQYIGDCAIATMAATCALYDLLYASSTGYNKAKANVVGTIPCVAMCLEAGTGARKIMYSGTLRYDTWAWTPGGLLYVSPTTAGAMTQTRPSTVGHQVQVVGHAVDADRIRFEPNIVFVEV